MQETIDEIQEDEFSDLPEELLAEDEFEKQMEVDRKMSEKLSALGTSLQAKADEVVAQRRELEDNWLDDLAQYNGKYSATENSRLKQSGGSQLFANITRPKVNAAEARISDILFPTDDRNWDIRPTPVPDMQDSAI